MSLIPGLRLIRSLLAASWRWCAHRPRSPARAELHIDITHGKIEPMPIAIPAFGRGTADDRRWRSDIAPGRVGRSGALRPVPAARPARLYRQQMRRRHTAAALTAIGGVINAQALITGNVATAARRPAAGRFPPLGRSCRAAADRPALHDHAAELAAHRPHRRRRHLQAHHRRGRLFRHPHRLHRRKRPARSAASSASPSWIRTAPTTTT